MKKIYKHPLPPLLLMVLGFVLVGYMVIVENELGAIPLLLVAAGITWFFVVWATQ